MKGSVGAPCWWGPEARAPCPPPLNPALLQALPTLFMLFLLLSDFPFPKGSVVFQPIV